MVENTLVKKTETGIFVSVHPSARSVADKNTLTGLPRSLHDLAMTRGLAEINKSLVK